MEQEFREIEIKDFLGISTRRNPQLNECAECINFDLRDKDGDLIASDGSKTYLAAPDFSSQGFTLIANLGFTTHVFSQLEGVLKDVTFYFQRGTVGGYPHIAIGMYPCYFAGYGWFDQWGWLNKIAVGTIDSIHSTYSFYSTIGFSPTYKYGSVIYNVTKQEWAKITSTLDGDRYKITNDCTTWAGDTIIMMANYQPLGSLTAPFPYLTAQSAIVAADLSFHRVNNELRVGFGSVINRLAIGIGYKKKYFQIGTLTSGDTLTNVTNLENIILDPYNTISDSGTFSFGSVTFGDGSGIPYSYFPAAFGKTFYLRMTAILDDYNEFVVVEQNNTYTGTKPIYSLQYQPLIRFATMNKRLTKIRVWLAGSGSSGERNEDYKLVQEFDIAKSTAGTGWTLASDGFLKRTSSSSYATITYDQYAGQTETQALRMTEVLGYTPTTQYASSWDQALIAGTATYLLNPYIDKPWKNFIFNSPISGAGASQYDVISADNYQSLDTKDGNDIVGIELNSNLGFSIFRNNGFQQYDPIYQVPSQMIEGNGAVSRLGIVKTGNVINFPSQKDIFINSGNQIVNISEKTIRDAYRELTAVEKASIIAGKDQDGSYRFIATSHPEYIFIKGKGWIQNNSNECTYYGNKSDGTLLLLDNDGVITELDPEKGVNVVWTSIPIDISLMGKELPSDARFIIGSVWLEYTSDTAITLSVSFDGGSFVTIGTFPANVLNFTGVTTDITTDRFAKSGHGFVANDRVTLSSIVTTTGISTNTVYYVQAPGSPSADYFQLSLTKNGSAVDLQTGNGTCAIRKTLTTLIKKELRLPPGRNAKYFQIKLTQSLSNGDARTRISAVGIRWKIFKTGLFR